MAISTYAELQTEIATRVDRTDFTSVIQDCIRYVESELNLNLRTRRQLQRSYTELTGEFVAVPADYLAFRNLDVTSNGIRYPVGYLSPEQMDRAHSSETGLPRFFTLLGDEIQLYPVPDSAYRFDISYFQKISALSDTNTTNWVLTDHPQAYVNGALWWAWKQARNQPEAQSNELAFRQQLAMIQRMDKRDKYSGGSLTMRPA